MKIFLACTFFSLLAAEPAGAQVLSTADTLGKGTQSALASDSRIFVDGARLHIIAGQYVRGLTARLDLYLLANDTRTEDEEGAEGIDQFAVGAGGNWNCARSHGFSFSLFGVVTVPLTRRDQASRITAT